MSKKELISEILSIEEVDTRTNLYKKTVSQLQSILDELKSKDVEQEKVSSSEVVKEDILEALKKEMIDDLREQVRKELEKEYLDKEPSPLEVVEEKPIKKKEIDRFEPIPVMNVTNGKLIYVSKKTGAEWVWGDYGDIEHVEFQELLSMRSGQKAFIDEPFIFILDEDVVNYLGLNKFYEKMHNIIESLDDIFNLSQSKFEEVVDKAPRGIKHSIVTRAREKVADGTLDSVRKIKYLNDRFKTDIGERKG